MNGASRWQACYRKNLSAEKKLQQQEANKLNMQHVCNKETIYAKSARKLKDKESKRIARNKESAPEAVIQKHKNKWRQNKRQKIETKEQAAHRKESDKKQSQ